MIPIYVILAIAIITVTFLIVGGAYLWHYSLITKIDTLEQNQAVLEQKIEYIQPKATEEEIIKKEKDSIEEEEKGFIEVKDYEFKYPTDWIKKKAEYSKYSDSVDFNFYDQSNNLIAMLACPIPEIGFEAMIYEETKRHIKKNNKTYEILLWEGKIRPELIEPDFDQPEEEMIIFMRESDWLDSGTDSYMNSCMLIIRHLDDLVGTAQDIYHSIK